MLPHSSVRAGLVACTLALCVLLVSAVPVPTSSLSSCSNHPQPCTITKRDLILVGRSGVNIELDVREYSPFNSDVLVVRSPKKKDAPKKQDAPKKPDPPKKQRPLKKQDPPKKQDNKQQPPGSPPKKKMSVGQKIKNAFHKFGEKVKNGFKKVGQGIKTAAKKVGHFFKTTGAKIAKVGLKVISTIQSVGSKVVKFIPVIGKPLSAGLKAVSTATNAASNAIHANLGKKMEKGMKVMDKIRNPVSGAAGAVLDNVLKRSPDKSGDEVQSREWSSEEFLEIRENDLESRTYWDGFYERDSDRSDELLAQDDQLTSDLSVRGDLHEWETRNWNEWDERKWERQDTREWDDEYEM